MTHIRKIRLVLPARMAATAPQAAREIAARMIDAAHGAELSAPAGPLTLRDRGQGPAQIGLAAGLALRGKAPEGRS